MAARTEDSHAATKSTLQRQISASRFCSCKFCYKFCSSCKCDSWRQSLKSALLQPPILVLQKTGCSSLAAKLVLPLQNCLHVRSFVFPLKAAEALAEYQGPSITHPLHGWNKLPLYPVATGVQTEPGLETYHSASAQPALISSRAHPLTSR